MPRLFRHRGTGSPMVALLLAALIIVSALAVYQYSVQRSTTTVTAPPVTSTVTATSTLPASTVTSTLTVTQTLATSTSGSVCGTTSETSSTSASQSFSDVKLVDLARNFTSLSLAYGENSSGRSIILHQSYNLVYASQSTYKMTFQGDGAPGSNITAWVLSNGTILAADSDGQNYTGLEASSLVETSAPVFYLGLPALNLDSQLPFPFSDLRSVGSSNVTLGSTQLTVTNYRAVSLPLTFCSGSTAYSLSTFVVQTAPIPGRDFFLITYVDQQGTASSQPYSFYLSISSIALT